MVVGDGLLLAEWREWVYSFVGHSGAIRGRISQSVASGVGSQGNYDCWYMPIRLGQEGLPFFLVTELLLECAWR